jgi:hypothetical protein
MISVDMSTTSAGVTARWYDPTIGKFLDVSGSPFPNTGTRLFKPPSNNHDGDGDWVLVLEAAGILAHAGRAKTGGLCEGLRNCDGMAVQPSTGEV